MNQKDTVLSIANSYGSVDVKDLPKGYSHVPGKRLQPICRKLGIKYAQALVGWGGTKRYPKPEFDGVVVTTESQSELLAAIAARTERTKPSTPEQKAKEKVRRQQRDIDRFSKDIRSDFPSMPEGLEFKIATHSCLIGSRRVGRSTTADDPVFAAVVAHVRHNCTNYDDLLDSGACDREEARAEVSNQISEIIDRWQEEPTCESGEAGVTNQEGI